MKHALRQICHLVIGITVLFLLGSCLPVDAREPTLARLSFWVPPARMVEFEAAYEEQIAPILNERGLVESSSRSRTTADSVFSRLFEFASPTEVITAARALQTDRAWQEVLQILETTFTPDVPLSWQFCIYRSPVGPGRTVQVGPGVRQGAWQTYGIKDGFPISSTMHLFQDRQNYLWIAAYEDGVSRYDGARFTTFTTEDGLAHNNIFTIVEDRQGHLWFGSSQGGLCRYDGEQFVASTTEDGRAIYIYAISEDQEGNLWFGTVGAGVSRYDGERFTTFTIEDGLANNQVTRILEDREGYVWFGSFSGGITRYDGRHGAIFTTEDGLPSNGVMAIAESREGNLFFGTWAGACRYDGETFTILDYLRGRNIRAILEDRQENFWFGIAGGGVSRYDGARFTTFTTEDGLSHNSVLSLLEDRQGNLWIGTRGGVSRYDGARFTAFTTEDGLAHNRVSSLLEDRQGNLWIGTWGGGVSRYDGVQFTTFTNEDGLAHNIVIDLLEDLEGNLWIGTYGGGVSRYDGRVFQNLYKGVGLAHDAVQEVFQDSRGDIWIATEGGVNRYRYRHTPPDIQVTDVSADRRYGPVGEVRFSSLQKLVVFSFAGRSWTTGPGQLVYVYRLMGYDETWRQIHQDHVAYTDLPLGDYVFQVQAVDRDLNYSELVEVQLTVHPPYWQLALIGALCLALVGLALAGRYGVRRRQERDQTRASLLQERRRHIEVPPHDIESWTLDDFVETSPAMQQICTQIRDRQTDDHRVLITGEAGTGKELVARAIHAGSARGDCAFVPVRCADLPADLAQSMTQRTQVLSQLFGHVRDAFPGADTDRDGWLQQAQGGILFFDEVGLLPLPLQSHLLRVLIQGTVRRVGASTEESLDVRVLAATREALEAQVELGTFHQGLYEYLAVRQLAIPPLRERPEDIGVLAQRVADAVQLGLGRECVRLSDAVVHQLEGHAFPGNARELRGMVEQALRSSVGRSLSPEDLPSSSS